MVVKHRTAKRTEAELASGTGAPSQSCRFLLVSDGSAAQRARRLIAEPGACTGVVVGGLSDPALLVVDAE